MFPYIEDRVVTIDLETTGLNWRTDKVFGLSVYPDGGKPEYYDLRKTPSVKHWLADQLPNVKLWVNQNVKFDVHFLMSMGINVNLDRLSCTMTRAALIDEHLLTYDLDSLGRTYLKERKDSDIYVELARIFGGRPTRNAQISNFPKAPVELMAKYANQDTVLAYNLWLWQEKEIERQNLRRIVDFEHQLMPVIIRMERRGIRIDEERVHKSIKELAAVIDREQLELNRMAGFEVNPNPSGSIKTLFKPVRDGKSWRLIDGTLAESTDGGAASIDADCLRRMKHPAAAKILRLRKLKKASDTFLKRHILGHLHNGRVYCTINQTKNDSGSGTGPGRLSITDPALQQIPARDKEMKKILRPCFLPEDGHNWVGLDWAQMDFRMMAHYTKVPSILQKFNDDPQSDFHQIVADMTGLPRSPKFAGDPNAKQINLGLCFGMGTGKLAAEMGLPYTEEEGRNGRVYLKPGPEAEEVFLKYHSSVPGVREFLDKASAVARSRGYVVSVLGRHIRFPGGFALHKAGGLLFQSACADAMKLKMIEFDRYLPTIGAELLLTVHDELGTSAPIGRDNSDLRALFKRFDGIETPLSFRVPIEADMWVESSWYEP